MCLGLRLELSVTIDQPPHHLTPSRTQARCAQSSENLWRPDYLSVLQMGTLETDPPHYICYSGITLFAILI